MFTLAFTEESDQTFVKSNMGVNLRLSECHKLYPQQIYSKYSEDQLHYVIQAMQKGRKPHTQIGLRRLIRKNTAKNIKQEMQLKKKQKTNEIPQLNPKSPEQICMKVIRTQFRYKISKNHMQVEPQRKDPTKAMLKRKQNQKSRRIQLIKLTQKYRRELQPHFGQKLNGYGRCPKVSRKEIKDYLKTLGIQTDKNRKVEVDVQNIKSEQKRKVPIFQNKLFGWFGQMKQIQKVPIFRDEDFPSLLV